MSKKPFIFRLSSKDKIFFVRNLAMLLKSGISLNEAFTTLKGNTKSASLKYILEDVIKETEKGKFLSNSLEKFENQIGSFVIALINVGEISGKLIDNLERIAVELRKIERLRSKVISTLIYPAFIIVTMIGIIFLVVYFLFPKILPVFENLGVELPLITKIFIKITKTFLDYGHYVLLFLFLIVLLILFLLRNSKFKYFFHKFILNFPLLSGLLKKYSLIEFARNLSILLGSGVSIVEAINLTGQSISNYVYKKVVLEASDFVSRGHSLEEFLNKYPKLFDYNFIKMIEIGERTGNLISNLNYLTETYEAELDTDLERFVNLLEPIILVIIAIMVSFIALSIVIPIYELSDKLTK